MKNTIILLISLNLLVFALYGQENKKNKTIRPKILLTSEELVKCGFERLDGPNFKILLLKDGFVLGNSRDNNIIRWKSKNDIRQYKANGQGPSEFLYALSIFMYDEKTIGVHDYRKKSVLLFDMDLNYKSERKVNPNIRWISSWNDGKRLVASGLFETKVFAILDRDFKIKETLVAEITKSRFSRMAPRLLNKGYPLNTDRVALTQSYYDNKSCRVNIYAIETQQICQTLNWEQDHTPTEKDYRENINSYFSGHIYDYNGYHLVMNYFVRQLRSPYVYDLMIFDRNGNILFRDKKFPYYLIKICNTPKSRLFFITKDEDLAYIDIKELLES